MESQKNKGTIVMQETREERARRRNSKRAGSGKEMHHAKLLHVSMRENAIKNMKPTM